MLKLSVLFPHLIKFECVKQFELSLPSYLLQFVVGVRLDGIDTTHATVVVDSVATAHVTLVFP